LQWRIYTLNQINLYRNIIFSVRNSSHTVTISLAEIVFYECFF